MRKEFFLFNKVSFNINLINALIIKSNFYININLINKRIKFKNKSMNIKVKNINQKEYCLINNMLILFSR